VCVLWNLLESFEPRQWIKRYHMVVGLQALSVASCRVPSSLLNRGSVNVLAVVLNLAHGWLIRKGAEQRRSLRIGALHSVSMLQVCVRCDRRERGGSDHTCRRWDGVCHRKGGTRPFHLASTSLLHQVIRVLDHPSLRLKLGVRGHIFGALGAIIRHLTAITHDTRIGGISRISHGKYVFHRGLGLLGRAIFGAPCRLCKGCRGVHGLLMVSIKSRKNLFYYEGIRLGGFERIHQSTLLHRADTCDVT
jgi:hypothetical protein